jgi:ABC-type molybdate transport system substrate-binding protein
MKSLPLKLSKFPTAAVLVGFAVIEPLPADDASVIRVLAAGSLRAAVNEIGAKFSTAPGMTVENSCGQEILLRNGFDATFSADRAVLTALLPHVRLIGLVSPI